MITREREAARLTSSLYHLLPAIQDALEIDDPNLPTSLFDLALWQSSILASVLAYVQKQMAFIKEPDEQTQKAQDLFAKFLEAAQAYRARIDQFQLSTTNLKPADWLCVAGVNSETRVRMRITRTEHGPLFDLSSSIV